MKCLYINLDGAAERRRNLEASFGAAAPAGWELVRVPAKGPADVAGAPGSLTLAEKGCWLSHREALATALQDDEDVFIVEDDTRFARRTFAVIDQLRAAPLDWELLFTDVMLADLAKMAAFARQWRQLAAGGNFLLQDLAQLGFAGSSAYLVRGRCKRTLLDALSETTTFDVPYDLTLRDLAHARRLRARVCFPFLTTPGPEAANSSIQPTAAGFRDDAMNAYRRLMFVDRDLAESRRDIGRLDAAHADEAARLVGGVFAALVSDAFPEG